MALLDQDPVHIDGDRVEFGPFRLDRARRQLTKDGAFVPLGDRAFEILTLLIRQAPHIVSKATLFEQVWPGTFVEESTLRYQLWTLRKALGGGGGEDDSQYISTASGRGYCFVAPVSRPSAGTGNGTAPVPPPEAGPTNLPLQLTEIVGRGLELDELDRGLKHGRLVTLVGPGGIGKTRLALELGRRLIPDFPAGVWLIDLAPLTDGDAVAGAAASVLGVSVTSAEAAANAVVGALAKSRSLLIFDNCEHLAAAAAGLIQTLLARAPGIAILATSQKSLRLAAEQIYALDPLNVPPAGITEIGGFAAVELFTQRGRAADRNFALTPENGAAVAEICRQLDGVPLALEMAAGRLRMLGTDGLRRGLGDRLKLLKGTAAGGGRHGSLHGMLEWSHSLLAPFDQAVFRRLAALPGSFSLEAAIAVAGGPGEERWAVVDALGRLIDQSLVTMELHEPPRYRLLETLRLYASNKLEEAGEVAAMAERHAHHFVTVFDAADACWEVTPDADWLARYQPELGHLRAALDWALAVSERRQIAVALAVPGCTLLHWLLLVGEGRRCLDRLVPLLDTATPPVAAARILYHASVFYVMVDDPRGLDFAERSAALCRACDDRPGLANALVTIAQYRWWKEEFSEAAELLREARELLADSGSKKSRLRAMGATGSFYHLIQDQANAKRYNLEALDLARALKSIYEKKLLGNLSVIEEASGNIDGAIALTREALDCSRSRFGGNRDGFILANLASCLLVKGDLSAARAALEEALSVLIERANFSSEHCLRQWAVLSAFEGRLAEAARLIGFTDAERERSERCLGYSEVPTYNRLLATVTAGLSPAMFESLKNEGARWGEAEAITFVADRLMLAPVQGSSHIPR